MIYTYFRTLIWVLLFNYYFEIITFDKNFARHSHSHSLRSHSDIRLDHIATNRLRDNYSIVKTAVSRTGMLYVNNQGGFAYTWDKKGKTSTTSTSQIKIGFPDAVRWMELKECPLRYLKLLLIINS
jgi:hypothetical protein